MSSVSEASIAAGAAKTPRMANLESGQQHFTKAAVDAPGDVHSVASTSKDKKTKTTASVSSVKTSSSYAAAPSPESASALPPKRTVRRSNSRRSSSGSSHRSSTQQRPPTTPLKNHNTNNSVAGSVDTTMTLSATGLMQTSSVVAVAATTSPSPTKPASLQTAPAASSPTLPRRRSSSEATQINTRQEKYHDRNESWTFHEQELDSLLCQAHDNHHQDVPSVDCLDVSMQVLQNSMNQAKQAAACQPARRSEEYEQDEEEEEYYDDDQETQLSMEHGNHHKRKSSSLLNHHDENMNNTNKTDAAQPSSQSSWWMNIVQRLQNSHDEERYKWKDDLRVAKIQGKHLKSELRESIEQRIQWLEERLVWEDEQRNKPNGQDDINNGIDTIASVSSGTTMVTASTMGNYTNYTVDERNALHRTAAGAATNGVEVSFDTAQAIQRLGELEQRVQDFEYEKEQWERALSHAELELQKDKKLSGAMQKQLQRLAQEVDSYSDTNHKHCKEKQKVQKQLLQLLEQQLNTERCEWLQEKEILDHTIQQLNLDISQVNVDMRNTSDKLQRVAREEKKLRAQREAWLYDKDIMQISIQQLLTDKSSYKTTAESLRKELKAVKQRLGEANETEDTSTDAPAVESVYSELDESLDRAIAERDLYKQEAENLRKTLEMERARWQEAEAAADDTVNEIRHEFGSIVEELKAELKKTSSTTATQTCEGNLHQANGAQLPDDEQRLKEIRDEYTAVIDDLEGRLLNQQADDSRQLEECLAKNKELNVKLRSLERQHADDRGEWKLRLEAALADGRKLRDIKSSLEGEVRDLKKAHDGQTTDSTIQAQLQDALADSERLQLELAALRQSYEAEVQAIFDDAKARQSPTSKGEWKLQLEASLAETRRVRRLKEDLETEIRELKDSFAQEKNELLECGNINAEDLRRELAAAHETIKSDEEIINTLRAELDLLQNMESELRHQKDLYSDLKEKYDREAQEWSAQLDESRLHEEVEVEDLQNKLAKETKDLQKAVRREQKIIQELKTQHAVEMKSLKAKLDEPDLKSITQVKQLSEELHQVKGEALQTKLNLASEIQRITLEKDFRIRELELAISQTKERLQSSDQLLASVTQLIDGLHTDMLAIKASVESTATKTLSVDNSSIAELKTSVEEMQNGLNDTIAELTLEADAIMEIKSLVEAVAQDMKSSAETSRILEQQEGLLCEVREMRAQLTGLVESGGVSGPKDVMYQDAMTELQRKVSQAAELHAELEHAKIELEKKSTQLIHAEAEILTLNDQADAYSDEIMRMQALNADHEKNLRLAERKIQALLNAPDMPHGLDDFDECNTKSYDDSTPLLEEALALAQGLQELVQGRDSDQNVLEMLQSMSDLMDHHELADDGSSQASSQDGSVMDVSDAVKGRPHSPQRRQQVEQRDQRYMHQEREEPPPDPIQTPLQPNRHRDGSVSLQLVVEQLYGRCQMLERERTEMMEVTLSLLESARRANTAEMDAALATVRRRTMDDVIRVRKQTIMEQERLYQRLCENGGDHPQPDVAVTIVPPLERSRPVAYAE
ncbi:hypothetical protein MPSEU_000397400 [Mayamaea pseudoterrestris]|nr:hypothetical protein MPSEU_000397400 [Mayamaea pseudoterrestris]